MAGSQGCPPEPQIRVVQTVLPPDAQLPGVQVRVAVTFMYPSTTLLIAADAVCMDAVHSLSMPEMSMSMSDSQNQVVTSNVLGGGGGASDGSSRLSNLLGKVNL